MRRLAGLAALALVVVLAGDLPATADGAPIAARVTNGVFLVGGDLYSPTTGAADTGWEPSSRPAVSPDGSSFAGFNGETTREGRWILSRTSLVTGRTSRLATFPNLSRSHHAWSPDGRRVAVVWHDRSGSHVRVSVARVDGSRPPRLVATAGGGNEKIDELGWRRDTGELALLLDRRLVFVSPDGSSARTLEGSCSFEPPALPVCPDSPTFSAFDLSPDGSSAVVTLPFDDTLATVTDDGSGDIQPLTDDVGNPLFGVTPQWSPDGATIAFLDTGADVASNSLVPVGGGAVGQVPGGRAWEIDDWQPCPAGDCPLPERWSSPIAVTAERDTTSIRATGEFAFAPEFEGQPVTLTLRRWSGTRWVTLERTTTLAKRERGFRAAFVRPEAGRCRVTARYAGDEFLYLPATDRYDLRC